MLNKLNIDLWSLIDLATSFIDLIVLFIIISSVGLQKISNQKLWLRVILIILFIEYIVLIDIFPNTRIIICMILSTIYYKLSYKDNIYKCIIINLIFWLGLMVIEAISISLVTLLNDLDNIQSLLDGNIYRLQAILISKSLLLIELILFKYFKLSLEFKRKDIILIGIPIVANILSLLLVFGYNIKNNIPSKINTIVLILITFFLVLSSIILLIVIGKITQDDKLKLENELINERINTNYKNYKNMQEIHNRVRYIYHDLRNHMTCMRGYNTREEIIEYINDLDLQINDFEYFKNTGNQTLDIVLGEKKYICKEHNIEIEEYINISKLDFISNIEVCSIFSNALDNAIEACINIDEGKAKRIEVKVTYINKFCILKFINSKSNEIQVMNHSIQTTKGNKTIHGIGLASIKHIVNKYDGEVIVNYSDDEFILKIMIPIK